MKDKEKMREKKEKENTNSEYLVLLQRTQADFINFKKRTEEEKRDWLKFANLGLLAKLTPIMDNFRRAREHMPKELSNNDFVQGLMAIEKQFEQVLAEEGIEKIPTDGEFDPKWHEVVESAESDEPEGKILTVHEEGYRVGDRVLQAARVKVSRGRAEGRNDKSKKKGPDETSDEVFSGEGAK